MKKIALFIIAILIMGFQSSISNAEGDLFDTKTAAALFDKGMQHLNGKKLDEAAGAFEESLAIAPDPRTYYFLGYTYYLKGKTGDEDSRKKSIENFESAYELDPSFTPTRYQPSDKTEPAKPDQEQPAQKKLLETNAPASPAAVAVSQQKPQ